MYGGPKCLNVDSCTSCAAAAFCRFCKHFNCSSIFVSCTSVILRTADDVCVEENSFIPRRSRKCWVWNILVFVVQDDSCAQVDSNSFWTSSVDAPPLHSLSFLLIHNTFVQEIKTTKNQWTKCPVPELAFGSLLLPYVLSGWELPLVPSLIRTSACLQATDLEMFSSSNCTLQFFCLISGTNVWRFRVRLTCEKNFGCEQKHFKNPVWWIVPLNDVFVCPFILLLQFSSKWFVLFVGSHRRVSELFCCFSGINL